MNTHIRNVLIVFGVIILTLFTVGLIQQNTTTNTTTPQVQTINPDELKTEFQRIAALPYEQYKCRERSDLLFEYIHKHDPTSPVYTVSIAHNQDNYCHVFVLYKGYAYDPTSIPPLYNQSMDKYEQNLRIWGFTGMRVSTGYDGGT
jgi:hypothetical protein